MYRRATLAGVLAGMLFGVSPVGAAVVVIENRTAEQIDFAVRRPDGADAKHSLPAGALEPIGVSEPMQIAFEVAGQPRRYRLSPNTIHYFATRGKTTDLFSQPLAGVAATSSDTRRPPAKTAAGVPDAPDVLVIPVMLLADDAEPTVRNLWEKRLRGRVAAASHIFERYCRVRFDVIAVEMWKSDPTANEFSASVAEFERKVNPAPARLAIGFTGRYKYLPDEKHVGGIRGPFRSHILIREALWRVSEPERLEVLVHELGHYLGAVHSGEFTSVMRPKLGDRQAVSRRFRIGFDAPNTLAMYLIGEQLRRGPIANLSQLPAETKSVLRAAYASMAGELPNDPAAPKYRALLDFPFP